MQVKVFQIHKRSSYIFKDIQDKYAINTQKNIYAISDGATQGFMSQIWAEQLVKSFVEAPTFEPNYLVELFKNSAIEFDNQEFETSLNPAIKALQIRKKQMGAFATFMGAKIENDKLYYISSGDVCGAVVSNGKIDFFPFQSVQELNADKGFLGTKKTINDEVDTAQFKTGEIILEQDSDIILMTDAIARLVLKENQYINQLSNFNNFESFKNWIIEQWDGKQLEEDDISILYIKIGGKTSVKEFLARDIEFPKEEKNIVDISISTTNNDQLTEAEMKEINNLKSIIFHRDNEIKQQNLHIQNLQKQLKLLKGVAIGLVALFCIIALIFSYKKLFPTQKEKHKIEKNTEENKTSIKNRILPIFNKKDSLKHNKQEENKGEKNTQPKPTTEKERKPKNEKKESLPKEVKEVKKKRETPSQEVEKSNLFV